MRVLVTGAAGMIGRKLVERILRDGHIGDRAVTEMVLHDIVTPTPPAGGPIKIVASASDIANDGEAARLVAGRPDIVFHLAAVVSGEAEADFDKGYHVNLDGTYALFEALRAQGADYRPRVVFSSSIAVYGAPFPTPIPDEYLQAPLTSYGTQKVVGELLLNDYSRRGVFDGVGIRLPTVCVRPGKPNKAASGFFSNIIREPLAGQETVLPVDMSVRHWAVSPRAALGFLLHAATLDTARLGHRRSLNMPGVDITVGGEIETLRKVAGDKAVKLIRHEIDPTIAGMVAGWPQTFEARRALELGFRADSDFEAIVRAHVEDELGGHITV